MIDFHIYIEAAIELGHAEPISVEEDGTIWLGEDNNRTYLTDTELQAVKKKVDQIKLAKQTAKKAALAKLGLTEQELDALIG